jgi:segregation and condensation protein A
MSAIEAPAGEDPQADDATLEWESGAAEIEAGDRLVVDVEGFEGPLDLLLALARTQKVDLAKISVLALAQQYLDFIAEARQLRLEIAADYLVMAAWLAFLKSKLLLPAEQSEEGDPTGAELAALLAFRLKRLDAMREVSAQLMTRKRLGRDVFSRGLPEPILSGRRVRRQCLRFAQACS